MLTDRLPRVRLGHLPTPLHELPRLSRALGGPRIFVKRDDQTGLAIGGNKTRKLEFSVAEALRRDADTLVTLVFTTLHRRAWQMIRTVQVDWQVVLLLAPIALELLRQFVGARWSHRLFYLAATPPSSPTETCSSTICSARGSSSRASAASSRWVKR